MASIYGIPEEFKAGDKVRAIRNGTCGFHYQDGDEAEVIEITESGMTIRMNRNGDILKGVSKGSWAVIAESKLSKKTKSPVTEKFLPKIKEIKKEVYEHMQWDGLPERFKNLEVIMLNGKLNRFDLWDKLIHESELRALHSVLSDVLEFIDGPKKSNTDTEEERSKPKRHIDIEHKGE